MPNETQATSLSTNADQVEASAATTRPAVPVKSVGDLLPTVSANSLTAWFELYVNLYGGSVTTLECKKRDIRKFLSYFTTATGADQIDNWTRSITKGFLHWLEQEQDEKPNTVNRRLATLKHAASWIAQQRPFLAGTPTENVANLEESEPEWVGLSKVEETRIRAAAEQLVPIRAGANQRPYRDLAFLNVLLMTGLRVSELLGLDLADYQGKHLVGIKGKGRQRIAKKFVPTEARELLDQYIERERGTAPGALFLSGRNRPWSRELAHAALKRIQNQANANLPPDEQIRLSAHVLRHTHLRKITTKHGLHYAKEESGHASFEHLHRYVKPLPSEREAALESLHR